MYPTPRKKSGLCGGSGAAAMIDALDLEENVRKAMRTGFDLNPKWVEWLMGWPMGWTGMQPLETDRFRQWLRLHGRR